MLTIFKRIEKYEEKQEQLETRVNSLELDDAGKNSIFAVINRATWLVVGIVLAFLFDIFKK